MQPNIHLNWLAILVSVVASFALGGIWYGPLFGKMWQRALGFTEGQKPSGAEIAKGSVINIIGLTLMAFVMSYDVQVWRPSSWNAGADAPPHIYGFFAGFFIWVGFVVPILLNGPAFERKPWKVFFIAASYQFLSLQGMAQILSHWR